MALVAVKDGAPGLWLIPESRRRRWLAEGGRIVRSVDIPVTEAQRYRPPRSSPEAAPAPPPEPKPKTTRRRRRRGSGS